MRILLYSSAKFFLPMLPDDQPTVPTRPPDPSRSSPPGVWVAPSVEELQAKLPQYEVLEILGRGGMGAVYKARQKSLKRLVAIKILPLGMADDEFKFVERFQNEAQTMAQMNHPAIVSVYDFGETADGLLYFVMEFVDGTDVQKMIQASGKLSGEYALAITAHVCDALSYAHKRGVIHRDIKPANILIDQEGHIKVADFGLAKMNDPAQTSGLTKTNMAMGTPDYVAPEVLTTGMVADHRADLYAVGVMLYQMLTGEVPRGMFKLPSQKGIGSDERFDAIICKAMEQDREERYQSAMDVRRDLDVILTTPQPKSDGTGVVPANELPQKPVTKQPRPPGERSQPPAQQAPAQKAAAAPKAKTLPKKSSPVAMWLSIGGIVAVLGVAGFLVRGGKSKPSAEATDPSTASQPAQPQAPIKVSENPLAKSVSSSSAAKGKTIDLLPLADVARDAIAGEWRLDGDDLLVKASKPDANGTARLQLPYQPPEEYDFEIEFTPESGTNMVGQALSAYQHGFSWFMDGKTNVGSKAGFDAIDGVGVASRTDGTTMRAKFLTNGQRHRSMVEVRRNRVRALLDGEPLVTWGSSPKSYERLDISKNEKLRDALHLGLVAYDRGVRFHKITVREITGVGKVDAAASQSATVVGSGKTEAASSGPTGPVIDWINGVPPETPPWTADWGGLKDGVLTPTNKCARLFGIMKDGSVRVRIRLAPGYPITDAYGPMLQLDIRHGSVKDTTDTSGQFQFQVFVPNRECKLLYQQRVGNGRNSDPLYLWEGTPRKLNQTDSAEVDWEFRAVGDEFSAWADGKLMHTARLDKVASGYCTLSLLPGMQITRLETTGLIPTKPGPPKDRTLPEDKPTQTAAASGETTDWLKSAQWTAPWSLEKGRLKCSDPSKTRYLGVGRDGTVRLRFRDDAAASISKTAPPLQVTFYSGGSASTQEQTRYYQLQVFPASRYLHLLIIQKDAKTQADVPTFVWNHVNLPAATAGKDDMNLELRAAGGELSVWSGTERLATTRDERGQAGGWLVIGSPGMEITTLETIGITPNPGTISPPQTTDAPPPTISNWQDVTATLREQAKAKPGTVMEGELITWNGDKQNPPHFTVTPAGQNDYAIRLKHVGAGQINVRFDEKKGFIYVQSAPSGVRINRWMKGVVAPVSLLVAKDIPFSYSKGDPHDLTVTVQGSTISAWLDGQFMGKVDDTIFAEGTGAVALVSYGKVQKVEVAELRTSKTRAETSWTDWLTPKLAAGSFGPPDWTVEKDGLTTDKPIYGRTLMTNDTHDAAVRLTYDLRSSAGIQVTMRERKGTPNGREMYFADDTGDTLYMSRMLPDGTIKGLSNQKYGTASAPRTGTHTLELRCMGDTLTATVTGATADPIVVTATDATLTSGSIGMVLKKGVLLKKVEIAELNGATAKGEWQPIFMKPEDFGGDLRDVEFRDGATFLKSWSKAAPATSSGGGIRATLRFCASDRTGSLSLRSTEGAAYGEEDFACMAYVSPSGGMVMKVRDRTTGSPELKRHDFPLSPALKLEESFTFELRAADGKITASINGHEVGSVPDTWKGGARRFSITPSTTEMTEFRDVAVLKSGG